MDEERMENSKSNILLEPIDAWSLQRNNLPAEIDDLKIENKQLLQRTQQLENILLLYKIPLPPM